jgi:hypothetical protein
MSSRVSSLLGVHIANTTRCDETLHKSIKFAKDAEFVMVEYLRCCEGALQTLPEIKMGLDAIADKARNDVRIPIAQLDRVLSDYKRKFQNVHDEHEHFIDSAWKAWQDAMKGIIKAGQAYNEHCDVLKRLQKEIDADEDMSEEEKEDALRLKSVLQKGNEELLGTLCRAAETLRQGLTQNPSKHEKTWGKACREMVEAFAETGKAIAAAESGDE